MNKKINYKLSATIPVVQYGNLQPSIEMETDNIEDAHNLAMSHVEQIWKRYGDKQLEKNQGVFVEVKTFTGETILYDDISHQYTDLDGNVLISGSRYKERFEKPFDLDFIAGKVADKYKVSVEDVKDVWDNNSRISTTFGNAVHYTMEQYWKHKDLGCGDKNYHLPKHPILRKIIESFPALDSNVKPEVFVSSIKEKMVGQIDGIDMIDKKKKIVDLWDYKTDAEMDAKKLRLHFIQLSFYAHILISFGIKVRRIIVWNYNGEEWLKEESDPFDLKELEKELVK